MGQGANAGQAGPAHVLQAVATPGGFPSKRSKILLVERSLWGQGGERIGHGVMIVIQGVGGRADQRLWQWGERDRSKRHMGV